MEYNNLTVSELIEKLKKMPQDNSVIFYSGDFGKVYWDIQDVLLDDTGTVMLVEVQMNQK